MRRYLPHIHFVHSPFNLYVKNKLVEMLQSIYIWKDLFSNNIYLRVSIMATQLVELEERNFAFQNRLQTFSIVNKGHIDLKEFFDDSFTLFENRISQLLEIHYLVKIGCCFSASFEKVVITDDGEKKENQDLYLHTRAEIVDFETNLKSFYGEYVVGYVMQKIDDVELRGSGFKLMLWVG